MVAPRIEGAAAPLLPNSYCTLVTLLNSVWQLVFCRGAKITGASPAETMAGSSAAGA